MTPRQIINMYRNRIYDEPFDEPFAEDGMEHIASALRNLFNSRNVANTLAEKYKGDAIVQRPVAGHLINCSCATKPHITVRLIYSSFIRSEVRNPRSMVVHREWCAIFLIR